MSLTGENIDAYCSKCKLVLAHVIMFKVGEAVSKVKCNTCGAEHKYRPRKPAAKKTAVSSKPRTRETIARRVAAAKIQTNNAPMQWDSRNQTMDRSTPVKDYSIHGQYRAKDVVNHSIFGLGFVERIVSDKTMDVLFCDSVKLMAMNIT
ncbi:MAG: hypothetical protein AB2L12_00360 [Smithellaceae bacterium]